MWTIWDWWPSPDSPGYLAVAVGAYWVASFVAAYLMGIGFFIITVALGTWPIWMLILAGGFLWSLPFLVPGLLLLLFGLRMARS